MVILFLLHSRVHMGLCGLCVTFSSEVPTVGSLEIWTQDFKHQCLMITYQAIELATQLKVYSYLMCLINVIVKL